MTVEEVNAYYAKDPTYQKWAAGNQARSAKGDELVEWSGYLAALNNGVDVFRPQKASQDTEDLNSGDPARVKAAQDRYKASLKPTAPPVTAAAAQLKPTAPPVGDTNVDIGTAVTDPDIGTPPTEPGVAGGGGLPAAGVSIPEPTAPALSGYGSAGNAPQMGASAGAQQIAGPDSANPSLGKRIYPQGLKQLAALSPRIY